MSTESWGISIFGSVGILLTIFTIINEVRKIWGVPMGREQGPAAPTDQFGNARGVMIEAIYVKTIEVQNTLNRMTDLLYEIRDEKD